MNLNDIEKLEDAPKSQKMREGMERRYYRNDFPYKRVNRWLTSKIGQDIDKITSEFVKLTWMPARCRTFYELSRQVEINTFISDDGEICCFDSNPSNCEGSKRIREYYSDVFYVHPTTKLLCFHKQKKINWTKIYKDREAQTMRIIGDFHQLLKLDGIWYEVKGKSFGNNNPNKRMLDENGRNTTSSYPYDGILNYVKIILKKELNSKELKKFNLSNDGPKMSGKKCPKCGGYNCRIHSF